MGFRTVNNLIDDTEDYHTSYYVGIVKVNADPLGIGRVQADVPGLYDTTTGEVPWIGPKKDSPFGYGTGTKGPYGVYGSPQVGSEILIELQNGDEHNALYHTLPNARSANPTFKDPLVWGFQDPDGNMVIYNMASHTYRFVTAGGATIDIDGSGKRTTHVNGDDTESNGNWVLNVTGSASIHTTGDTSVNAQGSASVTAASNISVQAGGTASYTAAVHAFKGPVTMDSTLGVAGDITDRLGTGNSKTVGNMREVFDTHDHDYTDDGNPMVTKKPNQQI